jgi:hypothetical protein
MDRKIAALLPGKRIIDDGDMVRSIVPCRRPTASLSVHSRSWIITAIKACAASATSRIRMPASMATLRCAEATDSKFDVQLSAA